MGLFDQFPYTNFHELNLDWLLKMIKELENTVNNFVALNTIKYADPILWNITSQYEANTVVVDPQTGTAYISKKAVPSGVSLTNTDYWNVIFTLNLLTANQNLTLRNDGNNIIATFPSDEGDWLIWRGYLYKVSQHINLNEAYVEGYNLTRFTIEMFLKEYINNILNMIGDLDDLTTDAKDTIVNSINEIVTNIGDLDDLHTSDKSNIVAAINSAITEVEIKHYINPMKYGAVGDGVTDDSAAITAAIADLAEGYSLLIPSGYIFNCNGSNFNIQTDYISIIGGGTLKDATITIGDENSLTSIDYHIVINNIKIINGNTQDCIVLKVARNIRISDCELQGRIGVLSVGIPINHGTALINISNNRINCLYGIRAETANNFWGYTNDWHIVNNIFNMTHFIGIWLTGIDGVIIANNTIFTDISSENLQNILIDGIANNQVIITGNNLFEAGAEGIKLSECKGATVQNNSIVWPGQRVASNGIECTGYQPGEFTISNNKVVSFTKSGIEISGNSTKSCAVVGNNVTYSSAHYLGSEDLSLIDHYGITITGPSFTVSRTSGNYSNVENNLGGTACDGSIFRNIESMRNLLVSNKEVTAATEICNILSNRGTNYGGGLLIINAMPNFASNATTAVYILNVSFHVGESVIDIISQEGYTTGDSASHPSFTFSISNNKLIATPVRNTSGTFQFGIQSIGDIGIGAI